MPQALVCWLLILCNYVITSSINDYSEDIRMVMFQSLDLLETLLSQ